MENKHNENDINAGEVLTRRLTLTDHIENQNKIEIEDLLKDIQLENLLDNFGSNGVDLKFFILLDKTYLKDCLR